MAKDPYRATNRKEFVVQMCRVMDWAERVQFSTEFLTWAVVEMRCREIEQEFTSHSPGYQRTVMHVREEDHVVKSRVKQHVEGLTVNKWPNLLRNYVPDVLVSYQVSDFAGALACYSDANSLRVDVSCGKSPSSIAFTHQVKIFSVVHDMKTRNVLMNVWLQLRLRLSTIQDDSQVADTKTVQAFPPIKSKDGSYSPSGRCHCVLVHDSEMAQAVGIQGMRCHDHMPIITDGILRI
jgi:hypothetical protein